MCLVFTSVAAPVSALGSKNDAAQALVPILWLINIVCIVKKLNVWLRFRLCLQQ
jgi:hypothetical protein